MTRRWLFVLLLATVVVLADDRPKAQHAAGAAAALGKKGAAHAPTQQAQAPTQTAHKQTEEAQPQTEAAQGKTEDVQTQADKTQTQTEEAQPQTEGEAKLTSTPGGKALGMSILGNQEAPKSLVIVPWKTSELGRSPGISPMLDDSRQPVDKEVFMRALRYYEIISEKKR